MLGDCAICADVYANDALSFPAMCTDKTARLVLIGNGRCDRYF
jgi:hypothetical protein